MVDCVARDQQTELNQNKTKITMTMMVSRTSLIVLGWSLLSSSTARVLSSSATTAPKDNKNYQYLRKHDFRVIGLEDVEPAFEEFEGDMYAGRLPVDRNDFNDMDNDTTKSTRGEFQFWLFAPYHPTVPKTLMLWFNGGPGCSSFSAGLLFEHSPVTVPPHPAGYCCSGPFPPLQANPYAWTQATYMLYVEQPAGTGFSTGLEPQSEDDVARDMVDWLTNFYRVFDDLANYELFVFGESYAGTFLTRYSILNLLLLQQLHPTLCVTYLTHPHQTCM